MTSIIKRIDGLDFLKGIGIMLVYLGHATEPPIKSFIYLFHMPLFFFISGYLFNYTYSWKVFLKKRIKGMLLPYLIISIGLWWLSKLRHPDLTQSFWGIFIQLPDSVYNTSFWFIGTLFISEVVFWLIMNKVKTTPKRYLLLFGCICISLILKVINPNFYPWSFDVALFVTFYLVLGYKIKQRKDLIQHVPLYLWLIAIILGFLTGYLNITWFGDIDLHTAKYGNPILLLLSSSLICMPMLFFAIKYNLSNKLVNFIGRNSLIYYMTHSIFIAIISKLILQLFTINNDLIYQCIILLLGLILGIPFIKIWNYIYNKITSLLKL